MSSPSSPSLAIPEFERRRWHRVRWLLRWTAIGVIGAWSLAVLAWLTLHWGILPRLDEWRPQIEARVSTALGLPVQMGRLRVRSTGWVPVFEIDDLRVLDAQGRSALHLARVVAALSPQSLLVLQPRFAQLLLDDVSLDIRRDRDGRFFVAGLDMQAGPEPADPAALDWLLEQHEVVIRGGTLRWTDELRGAPPLALSAVDLVLRNGARRHEVRIDATPAPEWGDRFTLRARFTQPLLQRASDWQRWSGEAYADLPRADVARLREHVDLPFELSEGRGALRAWVAIDKGRPVSTTADLALAAVSMKLEPSLPALALERLEGRVEARQDGNNLSFGVHALSFDTDDRAHWAPATAQLTLERAVAGGPVTGGSFRADRLDLATLSHLAARLPLGRTLHEGLTELKPRGSVHDLVGRWSGPLDQPQRYQVQAKGRDLFLAAGVAGPADATGYRPAGRPGLQGADLEVSAHELGGHARLSIEQGALFFPGVFDEPQVAMRRLNGRIDWQRTAGAASDAGPQIEVTVQDLGFANDDAQGTLNARWRTGPGEGFGAGKRYPGLIELKGRIERGQAVRVARYLPTGVPSSARDYVRRAVRSGQVHDARFELDGDLWRFPFVGADRGVFRITAKAENVNLAYVPSEPGWVSPWPEMSAVSGELEFDRVAMRIRNAQATLSGLNLRNVRGGIADMAEEGVLRMDGQVRGALPDMLRYVHASPVGQWIGGALQNTASTGPAELTLGLQIPLDDPSLATVRGAVQLAGNDIRIQPGTPLLANARGRVDFTQRGLTIVGGRARVLGGEATFEGGTQADGTLRFNGQGMASADGLLKAGELPGLALLAGAAGRIRGQAPYRVQLGFPQGRTELQVTSSLAGLGATLPAPLAKAADVAWPLRLQIAPLPARDTDLLTISVGEVLQARYERDQSGPELRIMRGSVGLGQAAPPMPASGVAGAIRVARLDTDAWRALLDAGAAEPAIGSPALQPTRLSLAADELIAEQLRFSGVRLELAQQATATGTRWQAQVRADQGEGQVEMRVLRGASGLDHVFARFKRLSIPSAETGAVSATRTSASAPTRVPSLDLSIEELHWRGKVLGAVDIVATHSAPGQRSGDMRWQLDKLRIVMPEATLEGQGRWSPGAQMALDFGLDLRDSGRFAERLGAGNALRGGRGHVEGRLAWAGSPLAPDLASLDGALKIALEDGRFLNAEPGAARLLGVLSLQALPRRLLLDFRDVFQQGFGFDKVSGDVSVQHGVARTDNLRIVGVQAAVLIEGSADLQAETQDLRIVAVPEINAGAASLAVAAINPAVALGTFLAQWLLREPMIAANTREFHITGGWADPKVETIDRTASAARSALPASEPRGQ